MFSDMDSFRVHRTKGSGFMLGNIEDTNAWGGVAI